MLWRILICTINVRDVARNLLVKMTVCLLKPCKICDGCSESQWELLSTPTYRIRKDKKAGLLVSPKEVTVLSTVDSEPTFQSPSGAMAHVLAQPPVDPPSIAYCSSQQSSYVTAEQFSARSDRWAEQFPVWKHYCPGEIYFQLRFLQLSLWTHSL